MNKTKVLLPIKTTTTLKREASLKKLYTLCADSNSQADFEAFKIKKLVGTLENKRILVIGCGSVYCGKKYEPWLCRLLLEYGAKVVGIDVVKQDPSEKFISYVIDLTKRGELSFLADSSFDFIVCNKTINLHYQHLTAPEIAKQGTEAMKTAWHELFRHAKRALVSGGYLCIDEDYYKKESDRLMLFKKNE